MKDSLEQQVKTYADTFAQWVKGFDRAHPLRAADRHRQPEHVAARGRDHRAGAQDRGTRRRRRWSSSQAHTRTGIIAVGIAMVAFGLGFQLADRTQHHAPAQRPGRRDAAARRRRHQRPHSRHPRARRDRRDGAHGDRVPRQHDRAGKARRHPDRSEPRAGAAQRHDCAHHRAIQALGRKRAEQAARRRR